MIKDYKNGNVHCKKTDADWYDESESALVNLLNELFDSGNIAPMGEGYCVGNFDTAQNLYCYDNNKKYCLMMADVAKWDSGKEIILYANDLDEYDKEYFDEDGFVTV